MITATSLRSHDHGYTGSLRVGLISVPVHSIRDPYSGELRGVSHDLGRELANRLGVPFEPIVYPNPAAGSDRSKGGAYDERADRRSWEAMTVFFREIFK